MKPQRIIYLILLINFLTHIGAKAQRSNARITYHVTYVKGEIVLQKNKKVLRPRDVLTSEDKIQFRTAGAKIGAVSLQGQRYMAVKTVVKPEFYSVIETFLHGKKAASDRGGVEFPTLNSLKQFLAASETQLDDKQGYEVKPFALLEKTSYNVELKGFEQNVKQFFFIQFKDEQQKDTERRLDYEDKYLIIKRKDVEDLDGKAVDIFFQKETGEKLFISQMMPVVIDEEALKEELSVLIKYVSDKHPNRQELYLNEIVPHIEEFYGKIDEKELKEWLKTHLKFDIEK